MAADCLAMPGSHNRQNLLLATAAGLVAGLSGPQMEQAFRAFPGVPHRLERLRDDQGITYYNDSKATNYDAAEVALQALTAPLVVLAGGESKQGNPDGWLAALNQKAAAVVLFGAAQGEFQQLLSKARFPGAVHCCEGLDAGVPLAAQLARTHQCGAVLLSPACASFDQYSDFEARGDHFRQLVAAL
jgi:UDP-N-acetylmuramoylalanine--D-glutamate ligase